MEDNDKLHRRSPEGKKNRYGCYFRDKIYSFSTSHMNKIDTLKGYASSSTLPACIQKASDRGLARITCVWLVMVDIINLCWIGMEQCCYIHECVFPERLLSPEMHSTF